MNEFIQDYSGYFQTNEFIKVAPSWFQDYRNKNFSVLKKMVPPKITDEDWRFTNLNEFFKSTFVPLTDSLDLNKFQLPAVFNNFDAHFIYLVNGTLAYADESDFKVQNLKDSIVKEEKNLIKILNNEFSSSNKDFFYLLNNTFLENGIYLELEDSKALDKPIVIVNKFDSNSSNAFVNSRNIFFFGKSSKAQVIEYSYSDSDEKYFSNKASMILQDQNSSVEHLAIEDGNKSSFIFSNLKVKQERDSNFTSNSILIGGKLIRNNVHPLLDGENSYSSILGLYLSQEEQLMDNYMFIEHSKPNCGSRQLYKGLLRDSSKGVFHGRILVHEEAQKTDAKQTNKNLLLSNLAQVDTKPQLEIYADDVKCTHGATTGQLNEDSLLYLRARGIDENKAKSMLIRAFTDEVVDGLTNKQLISFHQEIVENWFVASNLVNKDD